MKEKNDILNLLNKIYDNPSYSQRNLANKLGFSIGKINYCLRALQKKGLVKVENFIDVKENHRWVKGAVINGEQGPDFCNDSPHLACSDSGRAVSGP